MKFVIAGTGGRGSIYGKWAHEHGHEVTAIAEPREDRRNELGDLFGVPENRRFTDAAEMFALGKIADIAVISTQDRQHFGHACAALDQGYDLLLEKPISPDPAECLAIERKAEEKSCRVTVCHVLRYAPFFTTVRQILDSGELGKIVSVKHSENIGNFHMAHSYVRGNWPNAEQSGPIILTKSCHDLDILLWLVGSRCTRVSAFGSLSYFRPENAPEGAAERCFECPAAKDCIYDVRKVYLPIAGKWPASAVSFGDSEEKLEEALRKGPYGRCVYYCGNDVCDHMSTIMEFENGVTAAFSLSAQTNRMYRNIHIMCEKGEILGSDDEGTVTVNHFAPGQVQDYETRTIHLRNVTGGHNGGDNGLMTDLVRNSRAGAGESRSSVEQSVESHLMAFAMEKSRREHCTVEMDRYREELL